MSRTLVHFTPLISYALNPLKQANFFWKNCLEKAVNSVIHPFASSFVYIHSFTDLLRDLLRL